MMSVLFQALSTKHVNRKNLILSIGFLLHIRQAPIVCKNCAENPDIIRVYFCKITSMIVSYSYLRLDDSDHHNLII